MASSSAVRFEQGDVVQLKSGGPKMTVQDHPEASQQVHCFWFTSADELRTGNFRTQMLDGPAERSS